jgi:hypothetical protein
MKRILFAGLLALAGLALSTSSATAQVCSPFSGGICFKMFSHIHQHGPLYNYGPYYGYYPFEPYGPWNAQLQYTGPYPGTPGCGWNGCGLGLGSRCGNGLCGGKAERNGICNSCNAQSGHNGLFSKWFGSKNETATLGSCNECGAGNGLGHGLGHGWLNGSWGLSRFAQPSSALGTQACGSWGCGKSLGWSDYAKSTFKNIFHRTHPCSEKATCPVPASSSCNLCK